VGLKTAHVPALLNRGIPDVLGGAGFLEVHAENYMVDGGPMLRHLERVRAQWPLSIHGVGLSIGGDGPLDRRPSRPARPPGRFEPALVQRTPGLVQPRRTLVQRPAAAALRPRHAEPRVRSHRPGTGAPAPRMLLENPSTYLGYAGSTMDEPTFLAEVVRRTGCGLLLDVNNAYVSA
jgi:uncharacterized protein